jgi:hypothetical protein
LFEDEDYGNDEFWGSDQSDYADAEEVPPPEEVAKKPIARQKEKFAKQIRILASVCGQELLGTVDSAACFCLISDTLAKKIGMEWDSGYACDVELANGELETTFGNVFPAAAEGRRRC